MFIKILKPFKLQNYHKKIENINGQIEKNNQIKFIRVHFNKYDYSKDGIHLSRHGLFKLRSKHY